MRVSEFAAEFGWGARSLENHCLNAFGVGPKMLTRLARMHFAGALLQKSTAEEISLADIALKVGYCDQSHFTRDAQALVGLTPSSLRQLIRATSHPAWGYAVWADGMSPLDTISCE
jgi:AraC-like DNA-binding protein